MTSVKKRNIQIVPPEEFSQKEMKLTARKRKAVGIPAVISSMKHISKELGIWRGIKLLNQMNQKDGFDCPGCAWPDPDEKRSSLGEYCENGVKAIAEEASRARVDRSFFEKYSVEELSKKTDYWLGKSGRITEPLYLAPDSIHYRPISWDEAFEKIAGKLKELNSPDEAVFYTSGRTSNEAAYLYQLFARQFGTNNLPDCSNMCHESSGVGLSETLGIGKGSVTLEDLHKSELIVVMGQNPGTNHPRMLSALEKCKKNGGTVVSVNPIPEAGNNVFVDPQNPLAIIKGGTKLEDYYLQVKINGDVALLKAIMVMMLAEEEKNPGKVFDLDFIEKHTAGYDDLIADIKNADLAGLIEESGISEKKIREVAQLFIDKKKIIICWAMGLTQHVNGVHNIREIVNVLLLKGSVGIEGGGTCPVRGHSNVQGDRTMNIWEKPKEAFIDALESHFGTDFPRHHGYDAVESIKAAHENKVKFYFFMGGNFISATPDSVYTGEAIQNCEMTVQVSTKLNRSHLVTGKEALILPCISRSERDVQNSGEQFVSIENSMGVVQKSYGRLENASGDLKSEPAIVAGMGKAMFGDNPVDWDNFIVNYDHIRDVIERTINGFEDYNKRVRKPGGFYLPNGAREQKFNTANGKANFTINPVPKRTVSPGNLILMTIRTHDQYNTTIYGMDDRYRGVLNERRVVLMSKADMSEKGLKTGDVIHLTSHFEDKDRVARNFRVVEYDIAKGCVATYFPEANVLVPVDSTAERSNTPVSKFVEISLSKD